MKLERTRRSLFYLVGYLVPSGLALLLAPSTTMHFLLSNGHYDDVFPRFSGLLLVGLALVIVGIIRHRTEVLYPLTLLPRVGSVWASSHSISIHGIPCFSSCLRLWGWELHSQGSHI